MNSSELYKRLANFEAVEPFGPIPDALIENAERKLGLQFPPQYRLFLSAFGCGGVDSEEFIGVGGPAHLDIVKMTLRLRERNKPLPPTLLPIRGDGFGNYDCIDSERPTHDGECAIVQWMHDGAMQEIDVIAESFDEWFESILVMITEK